MTPILRITTVLGLSLIAAPALGQQLFSELVGPVQVKPVQQQAVLEVPFITWGGDVATFHANGGLETKPQSLYGKSGLNIKLTPGDDFVTQVKNYVSGKTPFLRGTFRMLGQASEVIGSDVRAKPIVVLQLSWSNGDHIVAREQMKTLDDLKRDGRKAKIACQQGGPHVGLLYDALRSVQLTKDDVEIVFVPDLTGENGPAETFRKDSSIDACCVITPDMIGLTGGQDSAGTGAEGTVSGARVLVSTQSLTRSIADVYAVRADWYQANRDVVQKFVAGYLRATEDVVRMRDEYESSQSMPGEYRSLLQMSQQIFGTEVLPTLEIDAHGLLLDCEFARLPGQIAFFEGVQSEDGEIRKLPEGFETKLQNSLDLAVNWGYAKRRFGFDPPGFDYKTIADLADLKLVRPKLERRLDVEVQGGELTVGGIGSIELDDNTLFSFEITFEPNQPDFSVDRYGAEFRRAIEAAGTYGGAVVVVRGHADPSLTLINLLKAGMKRGILKRVGKEWYLNGKKLDLSQTDQIVAMVRRGDFAGDREFDPLTTMQSALSLSQKRADRVKEVIVALAKKEGVALDETQLQPVGVGIAEPVVSVPEKYEDTAPNRRVEFRIIRVPSEAVKPEDFELLGGPGN